VQILGSVEFGTREKNDGKLELELGLDWTGRDGTGAVAVAVAVLLLYWVLALLGDGSC
jgi:hypothetical protein